MRLTPRLGVLTLMALVLGGTAQAQQTYPNRVVRIVVPYAAGGSVDPIARLVADRLSKSVGQNFVVENRPGAGGNIGIEAVVNGPHDGYTLLATPSAVTINPSLYSKVPYDLDKDLTPLALINRNAMYVLVNPSLGVKSLEEFIARAKANPKSMNYAISGNGTLDHLVCEHLRASAGVEMVRVNYQGVPKGVTALLAGEVQMMVISATAAMPYIRSGQLQALAVSSAVRSPAAPDVPTLTELGFKDFVMYGWSMLLAPSGVPRDIVTKLHDAVAKVVAQPDVTKIITDMGSEPQSMTLEELKAYVHKEAATFAGIVKMSGARID